MFEFIKHITSTFKKRNALRKTKIGLYQRYGISRFYTFGQVKTASELAKIEQRYLPLAYACFLSRDAFDAIEWDGGQQLDYDAMRNGIEDIGDYPINHSKSHVSAGVYFGSGDGGHGGGDGGGGGGGGGNGGGG